MTWPFLRFFRRKPDADDVASITGSTIVQAIWECPTKDQCNREKAELIELREGALRAAGRLVAENEVLRSKIGDGLDDPP